VGYFLEKEGSTMHERFSEKGTTWLPFASLALLALLVGAFAVSCGGTVAEQGAEPQDGGEEQASVDLDHPTLGDEDAPVVLTEYADYQ
jgi:protein-disulfide isomerase